MPNSTWCLVSGARASTIGDRRQADGGRIAVRDMAAFIEQMPKAELHMHIEGVLEPELKFDMAARNGLKPALRLRRGRERVV